MEKKDVNKIKSLLKNLKKHVNDLDNIDVFNYNASSILRILNNLKDISDQNSECKDIFNYEYLKNKLLDLESLYQAIIRTDENKDTDKYIRFRSYYSSVIISFLYKIYEIENGFSLIFEE